MEIGETKEKVAIVTGASRGIGAAIAKKLAEAKAWVVLVARDRARLQLVAASIQKNGGKAWCLPADVIEEKQVREMVQSVVKRFGRIDILVNNAGVGYAAAIPETTVQDWDLMMNTNARGAFLCSREVLKVMKDKKIAGSIINIASLAGKKGYRHQAAYCASKFALVGFTKVLAIEGQPLGIRVHLVCPGGVNTEFIKRIRPDIPPETLIQPEEVAQAVMFLLQQPTRIATDEILIRRFSSEII
ncbi:MAG: SDR family oxidoreductase [Candidatus Omnitrophica bacterium]|nr:SDR family oxidoreductase [Candidatus Omnitrophota bacterium]